jgi:RHS repeat-associated protein
MMTFNRLSALAILALIPPTESGAVTSLGRVYTFGFERGNLIRNWSFENPGDNWYAENNVLLPNMSNPRLLAKQDGIAAPTGSYVAKFFGSVPSNGTATTRLQSDPFPVQPNTQYTLSFFVRSSGGTAGVRPTVSFYSSRAGDVASLISSPPGSNYPGTTDWTLYSWTLTTPDQDCYAIVTLADVGVGQGGNFWFDDIVMEKASSATSRTGIREAVSFVNDANQVVQSQAKVAGGGNNASSREYLIVAKHYDDRRRPDRDYAEYPKWGNPDFDPAYAANSASYNSGANGKGTMGSFPFDRTDYWDEPGDPVKNVSMRGDAWKFSTIKSGFYFVQDLIAPFNPTVEPTTSVEGQYELSWTKDVEGKVSLTWTNALGQMVQSATQNGSAWDYTRYEYFPDGRLKKTLQPTDVPGDDTRQDFREVVNYNAAGEITSTYSKDRGLRKNWYNRIGNLRFSRHESQPAGQYDYSEYDFLERATSFGLVDIPNLSQNIIESRVYPGSGKAERIGMVYDNLSSFQSRTGLNPATLLPGITLGIHGDGRLVCDYNLNPDVDIQGLATADRIIATFYNYNNYGEVTEVYRYLGPIKSPSARIHVLKLEYDYRHRVTKATLTDGQTAPATLSVFQYSYDDLGRASKILGLGGRFLMSFAYYDWGGLKSVRVGGTGTGSNGTRIDFAYHSQEWIKEIKATNLANGDLTFQQILGYEDKALAYQEIPAPAASRLDGKITQQILKFANDVNSQGPLRLTNYQYDAYNRLTVADGKRNANANPLNSFQQIVLSGLTWTDTEDMDTRLEYDPQGRISSQQNGVAYGNRASFAYQGNSYRLDHVGGTLNSESNRNASAPETFIYDARGRLIEDKSKGMTITYGWDDMPVDISVVSEGLLLSDVEFYDASGNRAVRLQTKTTRLVPILGDLLFFVDRGLRAHDQNCEILGLVAEIGFGEYADRRWTESYTSGSMASTAGRIGLFGLGTRMGEITPTGAYRFFLRNHQGSVIRTIGDNGEYLDGASSAKDYLSQGRSRSLKTGTEEVMQTFTGKEFESASGLYAFGARWMDPDLGAFLTPDPAGEFPDPYSYVGHDPVNRIDPDGMSSDPTSGGYNGPIGYGGGNGLIQYDPSRGSAYISNGAPTRYLTLGNQNVLAGSGDSYAASQQQAASAASAAASAAGGNGSGSGMGYGNGVSPGLGGDRSPTPGGGPGSGYGPGPGSGYGGYGANEPCPDIGWMGSYSSYGGGYTGTVEYMRDLGASWMMQGGGTYTPGQGITSYSKNPGLWMLGFATNYAANMPPTTWTEGGITALSMGIPAIRSMRKMGPAKVVMRAGPDFIVTPKGQAIRVPTGATGPNPTRAPGVQYTGGSGGKGLNSRVAGVRVMEGNSNQGPRAVYMNKSGQTVDPVKGGTVPNAHPQAHHYLDPW